MTGDGQRDNGKRGLGTRAVGGMLVMLLAFLFISFVDRNIIRPILGFWQPVFVFLFGDLSGERGGGATKFFIFLLFSCGATLMSGVIIDSIINSKAFGGLTRRLYKISFIKEIASLFQRSTNAYRNLKQARSVHLRLEVGGRLFEIPALVTHEKIFFVDGKRVPYLVLYCPHTPTFFTGNTLYLKKEYANGGTIIDVPRGELIEDVMSAGIFRRREEVSTHGTTKE